MCIFSAPTPKAPVLPPERAAMRQPDNAAVTSGITQKVTDQARAATSTILTSGSGVTSSAPTDKKTLLGQ